MNVAMCSVRQAVEWSCKDLKQIWTSQEFKRILKMGKGPNASMYKEVTVMWNLEVCMQYAGEDIPPFVCTPSLERYLDSAGD